MFNLQAIHKPTSLEQALELLRQADTVILAGGTALIAEQRRDVKAIVDLSALKLAHVETRDAGIVIGATTTLAAIVDTSALRDHNDGVVSKAAHQTHANIMRNQATAGGTLITSPSGVFAVALCALEVRVTLASLANAEVEMEDVGIADFLAAPVTYLKNRIVTEIVIPTSALGRRAVLETVARTPSDTAIVSVCAALELENGIVRAGSIALGGVADTACRARDAEREVLNQGLTSDVIDRAAMAATSGLKPKGDFRGSAEYRVEMARVLTGRALKYLNEA